MKTRAAHRRETAARTKHEIGHRSGEYGGAMVVVRTALAELDAAQRAGASIATVRAIHRRIDHALGRAAVAAGEVHSRLFEGAGGRYHAEVDPTVMAWKRRLNTALTLRSQHQISLDDREPESPIATMRTASRAAYGPHQAGMEFDDPPQDSRQALFPLR